MKRRSMVGVGVAVVVLFAIAAALVGGDPLGGHERGAYLDVRPADGPAPTEETVDYASLSPGQQRVFRDAIEDEDGFVRIAADVDESVWVDNRYVSYRDRTYHVAVAVS